MPRQTLKRNLDFYDSLIQARIVLVVLNLFQRRFEIEDCPHYETSGTCVTSTKTRLTTHWCIAKGYQGRNITGFESQIEGSLKVRQI